MICIADLGRANRERRNCQKATYCARNPDRVAKWKKTYRQRHSSQKAFYQGRRRAALLKATPSWADMEAIREIYRQCAAVSKQTGEPHHVDHIVPLKSAFVCGLHVAENLRVIPKSDNLRKRNKFQQS